MMIDEYQNQKLKYLTIIFDLEPSAPLEIYDLMQNIYHEE